jgi:hypothetical protein
MSSGIVYWRIKPIFYKKEKRLKFLKIARKWENCVLLNPKSMKYQNF